jgi:hypothetical protein
MNQQQTRSIHVITTNPKIGVGNKTHNFFFKFKFFFMSRQGWRPLNLSQSLEQVLLII